MTRHQSRAQERRHGDVRFALAALVAAAIFAWVVITMQQLGHDLRTANDARDALARQVQRLGEKPVAGPPGSRGEPGKATVGRPGEKGDRGDPGQGGRDGRGGEPGRPGESGKPGTSGDDGPPGTPGGDGSPGSNGQDGQDGAKGDPGEKGDRGEQGPQGDRGPAGQSCEDGYSWQTPSYDPDARVCRRDGAPDPEPSPGGPITLGMDPTRRQW